MNIKNVCEYKKVYVNIKSVCEYKKCLSFTLNLRDFACDLEEINEV